jgi:hypothetical protein
VEDHKEELMENRGLTWIAVAALVSVATLATAQEPAEGPRLVVPEKILDQGEVAKGEVVEANFKLVNEGTETLVVKAVRPTCGCTVADFDREIQPGGEGWIKAKLDTEDFSGPVSKSILIMTNDPDEPTVTVVIKADVQPYIEILPRPLIRFNTVKHEQMDQRVVVVAAEEDRDFTVTGVDSNVPYLDVRVRKLEGEDRRRQRSGTQYEVSLSLTEDAPVGPVSAQLTVHTDHPNAREVPIKVYGVIRALLHVTPPQIQFGTVEAKVKPGRNVIVVSNRTGSETTEVTSATVDDAAFSTEVRAIKEGRRYQVTVTINEDADPGVRDAVLTLATTDPQFPELIVPVRANIR